MTLTEIGVIISLIGSVAGIFLQLKKEKSESKKLEADSTSTLVEAALKLNKQETDTLRLIYDDIYQRYNQLVKELEVANQRIHELEQIIKEMTDK